MKGQVHVNPIPEGQWPRCREVTLQDGQICCSFGLGRTYDLVNAYQRDPHVQFLKSEEDDQILTFVRAWGPLDMSFEEARRGRSSKPLVQYRALRRWLRAVVTFLSAFKTGVDENEAFEELIEAELERHNTSLLSDLGPETLLVLALRQQFHIDGDITTWIRFAKRRELQAAARRALQLIPLAPRAQLSFTGQTRKLRVEARWDLETLQDALLWMIWYDEFNEHPLICCKECRSVFRPATAHAKIYCSHECGHRVAARNWQRRKNQGVIANGSRKTR